MYNYNPLQARYDLLNRQKQELDSQMAMLQGQMNQQAPINQTFQITSPQQTAPQQFDFNGKVANGIEEAKKVSCNSLPVIIMDANEPKFYMRNLDGSFKTYTFQEFHEPEVIENTNTNAEIESLKSTVKDLQDSVAIIVNELTNKTQQKPLKEPQKNSNNKQGGNQK